MQLRNTVKILNLNGNKTQPLTPYWNLAGCYGQLDTSNKFQIF